MEGEQSSVNDSADNPSGFSGESTAGEEIAQEQEQEAIEEEDTTEAIRIEQELFAQALAEERGKLIAPEWKGDIVKYERARPTRQESRERGRQRTRSDYHAYRQRQQERNSKRPNLPNQPQEPYAGSEKPESRSMLWHFGRWFLGRDPW